MPTMPKAIAALFFAALGYFCGDLVKPLLPEGARTEGLNEVLAGIGLLSGWLVSGKHAGHGTRAGFGYGLTSGAVLTFWGIFVFAGQKALESSMARRYEGPIEAIQAMIKFGIDFFVLIATPDIIIAVVIGSLFGGWLTEWSAKRWT